MSAPRVITLLLFAMALVLVTWVSLPDLRRLAGEQRDIEVIVTAPPPNKIPARLRLDVRGVASGLDAPVSFEGQRYELVGSFTLVDGVLRTRVPYYPGYLVTLPFSGEGELTGDAWLYDADYGNASGTARIQVRGLPR